MSHTLDRYDANLRRLAEAFTALGFPASVHPHHSHEMRVHVPAEGEAPTWDNVRLVVTGRMEGDGVEGNMTFRVAAETWITVGRVVERCEVEVEAPVAEPRRGWLRGWLWRRA